MVRAYVCRGAELVFMIREKHHGVLAIMVVAVSLFLVSIDVTTTGKTVYTRVEGKHMISLRMGSLCAPCSVRIVHDAEYQVCGTDRQWENVMCPDGRVAVHRVNHLNISRCIAF